MAEVIIHIARAEHREAWINLRHALWPDCPLERHALEVEQLLAGAGVVVLAQVGAQIAGMAELSIRRDHVEGTSETPVPYLEGWFVAEAFRKRGIGRAMLKFVEEWAQEEGYGELASDAEIGNIYSIQLHGSLGFREVGRTVHFVKRLG